MVNNLKIHQIYQSYYVNFDFIELKNILQTEPQLELFSHAEVANSASQNHLARNSDAEKHPLSITEQQQHYKHLKGLERLSGSVDSGLMRANENPFWQIESLKRVCTFVFYNL